MDIIYSKQALKFLGKLHKPKREKIRSDIQTHLSKHPPTGDIRKLKGAVNVYRLRVNDYRVFYSEDYAIISIIKIGSRGDIYNGY